MEAKREDVIKPLELQQLDPEGPQWLQLREKYKDRKTVVFPWEVEGEWELIESILKSKIETVKELETALNSIYRGPKGKLPFNVFNFFSDYFEEQKTKGEDDNEEKFFLQKLVPFLQQLALKGPLLFDKEHELPILFPNQDLKVVLTKEQVACLLALGFFGVFNERTHPVSWTGLEFPQLNLNNLFKGHSASPSAALCVWHYFNRVRVDMPKGNLIVERRVLHPQDIPDWSKSTKKITKVNVTSTGTIEDSPAEYHADFANEFIGGGALTGGNVQEEILFVIKPECLCTMLFCAKMEPNETIIITGAERFCSYSGYGPMWKFAGDCVDPSPRDSSMTIIRKIVAMDAIIAFAAGKLQYEKVVFDRDLNKAYCGLFHPKPREQDSNDNSKQKDIIWNAFATGNWGCGAFGGSKPLKAIQQILAASEVEMELYYCTWKEAKLAAAVQEFVTFLYEKNVTAGQLYNAYCSIDPLENENLTRMKADLFGMVKEQLQPK